MSAIEIGTRQRHVVDVLGCRIVGGELPPGTTISPDAVGADLGVSRTVVREALRALEARGLIEPRHRRGTVVRPRSEWRLLDPDVIGWRAAGPDAERQLAELLVLREAIEPTAARLAAARGADAGGLAARVERMAAALAADAPDDFAAADREFHALVLAASGVEVLGELGGTIDAALRSRYGGIPPFTDATAPSIERHRAFVDAVARHDPDAAAAEALALVQEAQAEAFRSGGAR